MASSYKTNFFSSTIGDVEIPITPTSLDAVDIGANVPVNLIAEDAVFLGTVEGQGFVDAVNEAVSIDRPDVRYLNLTDVKNTNGLPLSAVNADGNMPGIFSDAGLLYLNGVGSDGLTPASTEMMWELSLPDSYVAGADIPVFVDCFAAPSAGIVAASTTCTIDVELVGANGETSVLMVSGAQELPLDNPGVLTYTIDGTGLQAGARILLKITTLVTTEEEGASMAYIDSIGYSA